MKKILVLLLCFNIVLAPTYTFANTPLRGWTINQQIAQGASTILTGSKEVILNGAKKIATGTAKITPTASQVSKVLARGAAGYALSVAVEQLLGAVDWVLDPANNQIVYTSPDQPLDPNNPDPSVRHLWYSVSSGTGKLYSSPTAAGNEACSRWGLTYKSITNLVISGGWGFAQAICIDNNGVEHLQNLEGAPNSAYDPEAPPKDEQKTLPLEVVAAQVISNAEAGDGNAQVATTAAAQDIINEAEQDETKARPIVQQLENTQSIPTDQTAKGDAVPKDTTGTGNPPTTSAPPQDLTLDFPIFCDWAPSVCQAAKEVIALPITLTDWWNTATQAFTTSWLYFKDWLDWTKNDSKLPDNQTNEVTELPIPELQENAISWSASCPPDVQVPINLYGQSSTLTFSWSPWCQLLNVIKPAIIASAYIGAAFIVLGLRT